VGINCAPMAAKAFNIDMGAGYQKPSHPDRDEGIFWSKCIQHWIFEPFAGNSGGAVMVYCAPRSIVQHSTV
jgi:hypothetical protein